MNNQDINDLLKAFMIIDEINDRQDLFAEKSKTVGHLWVDVHDILEKELGKDFYRNLHDIVKDRNIE